jgi:hypothetical protein
MIKLLNYTQEGDKVTLNFEKQQQVIFHSFAGGIFTTTTDDISKSAVKDIKQYILKSGLNAKLEQFLHLDYYEYFECGSYG